MKGVGYGGPAPCRAVFGAWRRGQPCALRDEILRIIVERGKVSDRWKIEGHY